MKPYIIDRIQDSKGHVIASSAPTAIRRVLTEKTARKMQDILSGVVENGTGTAAKIQGCRVAGKTGTAQKVEANGRYSEDKYVGTFVGFAPSENSMLACIVTVDEPQPVHFGAVVAAPAFSKVVGQSMEYLKTKSVMSNVASRGAAKSSNLM
jgi:cell division protein FtsI/penicillin-binding protein 2